MANPFLDQSEDTVYLKNTSDKDLPIQYNSRTWHFPKGATEKLPRYLATHIRRQYTTADGGQPPFVIIGAEEGTLEYRMNQVLEAENRINLAEAEFKKAQDELKAARGMARDTKALLESEGPAETKKGR